MPTPVPTTSPGQPRQRPGSVGVGTAGWMVLVVVALVVSGCRMDVDTAVVVEAGGNGTLAIDLDLDQELFDSLTVTGFDPTPPTVPGWQVSRTPTDDGERIRAATTFMDPDELADRVGALQEGLTEDDPRLIEAIELVVEPDGASSLAATVGVWLPSSTGVRGPGFADAQELAALAADPDRFAATFTVDLPGSISQHNADIVRGSTATWQLVPGEVVQAQATADPPSLVGGWVVTAVGIALLVGLVVLGVWLLRRRRRERNVAPYGRVSRQR